MAFLAVPTPPSPGNGFQARRANRLAALFADAEFLVPNPRQGILDGAQELAIRLLQPHLRGGVGFRGGHVDRVPTKFTRRSH